MNRMLAAGVIVFHGLFALGWWWLLPGGFAVDHVRFWSNAVWPWGLFALSAAGMWSVLRGRADWTKACVLALGVFVLSTVASGSIVFPDLRRGVLLLVTTLGLLHLVLAKLLVGAWPSWKPVTPVVVAAALLGGWIPLAQRADPPATRPLEQACPWQRVTSKHGSLNRRSPAMELSPRASVSPQINLVTVKLGRIELRLQPLLTFHNTSPSGGWTALSRHGWDNSLRVDRLFGVESRTEEDGAAALHFGGSQDWLAVVDRNPLEITAYCRIPRPLCSHLNGLQTKSAPPVVQYEITSGWRNWLF